MLQLDGMPYFARATHGGWSHDHLRLNPGAKARVLKAKPGAPLVATHQSRRSCVCARHALPTAHTAFARSPTAHAGRHSIPKDHCRRWRQRAAHGRSWCGANVACSVCAEALFRDLLRCRGELQAMGRVYHWLGGRAAVMNERSVPRTGPGGRFYSRKRCIRSEAPVRPCASELCRRRSSALSHALSRVLLRHARPHHITNEAPFPPQPALSAGRGLAALPASLLISPLYALHACACR